MLRGDSPQHFAEALSGRTLLSVERRGKYLLIEFDAGTQLVHLGMSGSLRSVTTGALLRKHDHVEWQFEHATLRLHDPRRFGAVLWHSRENGPVEEHPLLRGLGIEPFDPKFDARFLHEGFAGRKTPVKQALLAGDVVVGVGNI